MKTFEEKFTAWVDGRLTGAELAAIWRERATVAEVDALKPRVRRLAPRVRGVGVRNHLE